MSGVKLISPVNYCFVRPIIRLYVYSEFCKCLIQLKVRVTRSHQITRVKQRRARLVLGEETASVW